MKSPSPRPFTAVETAALLAALPLVASISFDTSPRQLARNSAASVSASAKLSGGIAAFTLDELRVMSAAVQAAGLILSNALPYDDPQLRATIAPHVFVYPSLLKHPAFRLHP